MVTVAELMGRRSSFPRPFFIYQVLHVLILSVLVCQGRNARGNGQSGWEEVQEDVEMSLLVEIHGATDFQEIDRDFSCW